MIRYLSHKLLPINPVYGSSSAKIEMRRVKSQANGDSSEEYWLGFQNHWGTHLDCPAHFFPEGAKANDYEPDFWHFHSPQGIEVKLEPGQLLKPNDLTHSIRENTDLLLLKSGWSRLRGQEVYSLENPGLDPSFGSWLRKKYASIRVIGFDWISVSSYKHREKGREAHRILLDPQGENHPILILEDMDLSEKLEHLKEVWVAPLRVQEIDSAPCTVLGVFDSR